MCDDDDNTSDHPDSPSGPDARTGPTATTGRTSPAGPARSASADRSAGPRTSATAAPSVGLGSYVDPGPSAGTGSAEAISVAADAARAAWEAENRAAGQRFVAAHQLMLECLEHPDCWDDADRPGFSVVDADVMASSHLVRMFSISTYKAVAMLSFAADLHFRYPAILGAMLQGRMDYATARILATQMNTVDDSVVLLVQKLVVEDYLATVEAGERPGEKAVRRRTDEIISCHDECAIRERKADAGRDRGARISKGRDGMASLHALLHSDEAAVLAEALDEKVAADRAAEDDAAAARAAAADATPTATDPGPGAGQAAGRAEQNTHNDAYTQAQRRADALMSLVCGDANPTASEASADSDSEAAATGSDDADGDAASSSSAAAGGSPSGSGEADATGVAVTLRPKVTVIVPGGAGGWADRARVEFARTGEAALQALMDMLASSDGASLQCLDPAPGADDDPDAALKYRPTAALATRIRLRDGTCRHPGCNAHIDDADLDHVVPFNHDNPAAGGLTVEWNMAGLCRKHHRFKTFNDWDYQLAPDGTLTITTPEGKVMVTRPEGPLAAYRRAQERAEDQAWQRQQRRSPDPGRISASGGVDPCDYVEQSSWARREAGKRARREKRRIENVLNRAARARRKPQKDESQAASSHAEQQAPDVDASRKAIWLRQGIDPIVISTTPRITEHPTHRHSRWWLDNHHRYKDNRSALEQAIRAVIDDLLNPPPF